MNYTLHTLKGKQTKITTWQDMLKEMPVPSPLVVLVDLFFILLVLFVVRSNYVFQPGIKGICLPTVKNVQVDTANKVIVSIKERNGGYVYACNGEVEFNGKDIEGAISSYLEQTKRERRGDNPDDNPKIVLVADEGIPYKVIASLYDFACDCKVDLLLATAPEGSNDNRTLAEPQQGE